jgi:hypothetical protein
MRWPGAEQLATCSSKSGSFVRTKKPGMRPGSSIFAVFLISGLGSFRLRPPGSSRSANAAADDCQQRVGYNEDEQPVHHVMRSAERRQNIGSTSAPLSCEWLELMIEAEAERRAAKG